ncbi:MAG: hypothetical protein ACR2N3_12435 [Pyrinomonadaceae bacterium]
MSVFENLIEELKQENLIEESAAEINQENTENTEDGETVLPPDEMRVEESPMPVAAEHSQSIIGESFAAPSSSAGENEFYRRRAMEEVSSLQMVEHILSGVERDQMKIVPQSYDNISVSKALHEFLQVSKNSNSPENASAEFKLMQETESWYSALAFRDKNILPAHLRRYCETTRPVLSAQALTSLARFYRNAPYSESNRSKFDMVVTRLFSREVDKDERELAFGYNEIIQHLSELYADWSSVSLYATDDDTKILAIIQKFEDFVNEAEAAASFEELVKSDFFNRLRAFKETTGENFYAPSVAAMIIDCNIRVGNIYVELLNKERLQSNSVNLENKYSYLLDQTISEATSKTLQLANLLEVKNSRQTETKNSRQTEIAELQSVKPVTETVEKIENKRSDSAVQPATLISKLLQVNKLILAAAVLTIIFTASLYFWTQFTEPKLNSEGVQSFQMDGYYFKDYLKAAKITNENLIGIVNLDWNNIGDNKKQEVLKNMLTVGKDKGFKTVRLQNNEGKTVGYASENNITLSNSNQN